jgi:plastocyanin domain-containing protein
MKGIVPAVIISVALIIGAIIFTRGTGASDTVARPVDADNVSIVDGTQIVEINAKGGYQPRVSVAKAGIPTVVRFNTSGTFDCSSAVRIPSMNISKLLPSNGSTDISIGTGQIGTLSGSCGMGMYPFSIEFQ